MQCRKSRLANLFSHAAAVSVGTWPANFFGIKVVLPVEKDSVVLAIQGVNIARWVCFTSILPEVLGLGLLPRLA